MKDFIYHAVDARGRQVSGEIQAPDEKEAVALIKKQGIFPTRLTDKNAPSVKSTPLFKVIR